MAVPLLLPMLLPVPVRELVPPLPVLVPVPVRELGPSLPVLVPVPVRELGPSLPLPLPLPLPPVQVPRLLNEMGELHCGWHYASPNECPQQHRIPPTMDALVWVGLGSPTHTALNRPQVEPQSNRNAQSNGIP